MIGGTTGGGMGEGYIHRTGHWRYGIFDRTTSSLGCRLDRSGRVLWLYYYKIYNGLVYV